MASVTTILASHAIWGQREIMQQLKRGVRHFFIFFLLNYLTLCNKTDNCFIYIYQKPCIAGAVLQAHCQQDCQVQFLNKQVDISPPRRSRDTGATSGTALKASLGEEKIKGKQHSVLVILCLC